MKATSKQRQLLKDGFETVLSRNGFALSDITDYVKAWQIYHICMLHWSNDDNHPSIKTRLLPYLNLPIAYGNYYSWLWEGLDDTKLETAFRSFCPNLPRR